MRPGTGKHRAGAPSVRTPARPLCCFAIISSRRNGRPADPLHASRRRQGSAGRAGAAYMGRRRGPGLHHRSRRRDEGFSRESPASGGVHTPGGGGYAAKTGTPVRATMPGRAFHCGGREGENPPLRPPGNGWGETGSHGHAVRKKPGASYGRGGARALAGHSGRKLETRSPPSFRHGRTRPAAFTHPTVCVPVVQSSSAGVIS